MIDPKLARFLVGTCALPRAKVARRLGITEDALDDLLRSNDAEPDPAGVEEPRRTA